MTVGLISIGGTTTRHRKGENQTGVGFCEIEKGESTAELPAKAIPKAYLAVENALEQTVQCALYFLNDFCGMFRILLKIHIVDIKNQQFTCIICNPSFVTLI